MKRRDPGDKSVRPSEETRGDATSSRFCIVQRGQVGSQPSFGSALSGPSALPIHSQVWMKRFFSHPCSYGVQNEDMSLSRLNFHSPLSLTYCSS